MAEGSSVTSEGETNRLLAEIRDLQREILAVQQATSIRQRKAIRLYWAIALPTALVIVVFLLFLLWTFLASIFHWGSL